MYGYRVLHHYHAPHVYRGSVPVAFARSVTRLYTTLCGCYTAFVYLRGYGCRLLVGFVTPPRILHHAVRLLDCLRLVGLRLRLLHTYAFYPTPPVWLRCYRLHVIRFVTPLPVRLRFALTDFRGCILLHTCTVCAFAHARLLPHCTHSFCIWLVYLVTGYGWLRSSRLPHICAVVWILVRLRTTRTVTVPRTFTVPCHRATHAAPPVTVHTPATPVHLPHVLPVLRLPTLLHARCLVAAVAVLHAVTRYARGYVLPAPACGSWFCGYACVTTRFALPAVTHRCGSFRSYTRLVHRSCYVCHAFCLPDCLRFTPAYGYATVTLRFRLPAVWFLHVQFWLLDSALRTALHIAAPLVPAVRRGYLVTLGSPRVSTFCRSHTYHWFCLLSHHCRLHVWVLCWILGWFVHGLRVHVLLPRRLVRFMPFRLRLVGYTHAHHFPTRFDLRLPGYTHTRLVTVYYRLVLPAVYTITVRLRSRLVTHTFCYLLRFTVTFTVGYGYGSTVYVRGCYWLRYWFTGSRFARFTRSRFAGSRTRLFTGSFTHVYTFGWITTYTTHCTVCLHCTAFIRLVPVGYLLHYVTRLVTLRLRLRLRFAFTVYRLRFTPVTHVVAVYAHVYAHLRLLVLITTVGYTPHVYGYG